MDLKSNIRMSFSLKGRYDINEIKRERNRTNKKLQEAQEDPVSSYGLDKTAGTVNTSARPNASTTTAGSKNKLDKLDNLDQISNKLENLDSLKKLENLDKIMASVAGKNTFT